MYEFKKWVISADLRHASLTWLGSLSAKQQHQQEEESALLIWGSHMIPSYQSILSLHPPSVWLGDNHKSRRWIGKWTRPYKAKTQNWQSSFSPNSSDKSGQGSRVCERQRKGPHFFIRELLKARTLQRWVIRNSFTICQRCQGPCPSQLRQLNTV